MIAVFTKYDQFKRNIVIKLEDQDRDPALLNDEMEQIFGKYYLANLQVESPSFVRMKGEGIIYKPTCTTLISVVQKCTRRVSDVQNLSK